MLSLMLNITSVLKTKIDELDSQIQDLNAQKSALESALSSITGQAAPARRVSAPASEPVAERKPARGRGRGRSSSGRARRGANQEKVLATLAKSPRRLTEIAAETGLTLTAAGGVLRALISKGLAAKGDKRGTYLAKGGSGRAKR